MRWDEPISPELALVDPELAGRLRTAMRAEDAAQETIEPTATPPRVTTSAAVPAQPAAAEPLRRRRTAIRVRGIRLANGLAVGIVALLALLPFLAFLPPRQAPSLAAATASTTGDTERTLIWPADPRASYYVVRLKRENRLARVSIPGSPIPSLPAPLPPGSYTWCGYTGYGTIDANQRHDPIAEGTFTVTGG